MTELETRLMDALKALSTQWDADQQQHVEELDILRARIDELAQQVTDSAAQHEQHAAALAQHATALQAQLQQLSTQVGILTEQYAHIDPWSCHAARGDYKIGSRARRACCTRSCAGRRRPRPRPGLWPSCPCPTSQQRGPSSSTRAGGTARATSHAQHPSLARSPNRTPAALVGVYRKIYNSDYNSDGL